MPADSLRWKHFCGWSQPWKTLKKCRWKTSRRLNNVTLFRDSLLLLFFFVQLFFSEIPGRGRSRRGGMLRKICRKLRAKFTSNCQGFASYIRGKVRRIVANLSHFWNQFWTNTPFQISEFWSLHYFGAMQRCHPINSQGPFSFFFLGKPPKSIETSLQGYTLTAHPPTPEISF